MDPGDQEIASKFRVKKKVCMDCYARLPLRASNCRKRKCGHSNKLRMKKEAKGKK
jgi:large subunit ribosomal protein L40e